MNRVIAVGFAVATVVGMAGPAAAADKVPMTIQVKGCDGCTVSATWNSTGKAKGKIGGKSQVVTGNNAALTFMVRKGYFVYFTATSGNPEVNLDAATVLVTQFAGQEQGNTVSAKKVQTLTDGAYFCMKAKKTTFTAKAAVVKYKKSKLLAFWANPQLSATGNQLKDGLKGVYGTQNTLLCKGKYY